MRVVSGVFKGKKLFLPNDKNTRPLKDLVKESIFNLIQHSGKINIGIKNSSILDLFSGSGSFGIECLSREAKKVVFFENYPEALKVLERNIKSLKNIKNYEIIKDDCFNFFKSNKIINLKFDIIFMDPPYKDKNLNLMLDVIKNEKILKENGILVVHRHKDAKDLIPNKLKIIEEKKYGLSKILFLSIFS